MKKTIFTILLAMNTWLSVYALQSYSVKDGETVRVKISRNELTRIRMKKGMISNFKSSKGVLSVSIDKKKGEVYITPTPIAARALSFFISDRNGSTYTILAEQYDIPSQTIVLTSKDKNRKNYKKLKSTPLKKAVKQLIKDMYTEDHKNYDFEVVNKKVKIWKESDIRLEKKFLNEKYIGQIYDFKNISEKEMVVSEEEFFNLDSNILAVSIIRHKLNKNESTKIFIVRAVQ